jgi:hypothetical protein
MPITPQTTTRLCVLTHYLLVWGVMGVPSVLYASLKRQEPTRFSQSQSPSPLCADINSFARAKRRWPPYTKTERGSFGSSLRATNLITIPFKPNAPWTTNQRRKKRNGTWVSFVTTLSTAALIWGRGLHPRRVP